MPCSGGPARTTTVRCATARRRPPAASCSAARCDPPASAPCADQPQQSPVHPTVSGRLATGMVPSHTPATGLLQRTDAAGGACHHTHRCASMRVANHRCAPMRSARTTCRATRTWRCTAAASRRWARSTRSRCWSCHPAAEAGSMREQQAYGGSFPALPRHSKPSPSCMAARIRRSEAQRPWRRADGCDRVVGCLLHPHCRRQQAVFCVPTYGVSFFLSASTAGLFHPLQPRVPRACCPHCCGRGSSGLSAK